MKRGTVNMLEMLQLVSDFQNMVHAIGDFAITKEMTISDYIGVPMNTHGVEHYVLDYSNGDKGLAGGRGLSCCRR